MKQQQQLTLEAIDELEALMNNPARGNFMYTIREGHHYDVIGKMRPLLQILRTVHAMFDSTNAEGRGTLYVNLLRELSAEHRNELALNLLGSEFRNKYEGAQELDGQYLAELIVADRERTAGTWDWTDEQTLWHEDGQYTVLAEAEIYVDPGEDKDYISMLNVYPLDDDDCDEARVEMRANLTLAAAAPKLLAEVLRLRCIDPLPPVHPEVEP